VTGYHCFATLISFMAYCALAVRSACNHPMLISKDYQDDSEALEPTAAKTNDDDEDDADDLAGVFGRLNVKTMTCQVCLAEYVSNKPICFPLLKPRGTLPSGLQNYTAK
jgi:hypothetical protein